MSVVLEGGQQRELLLRWIENAKAGDQVDLISPWISGQSLKRVLDVLPKAVRLNIVTRFPVTCDELNFTDWDALKKAGADNENVKVSVVGEPGNLHAKVYRVTGLGAIVTSANLTEAGLSSGLSGNLELGVLLENDKSLPDLDRWIKGLAAKPLATKQLELLQKRKGEWEAWNRKAQKTPGRPEVPSSPFLGSDLAADVIRMAIKKGDVNDASRLDGYGVRAFELNLNSRKRKYRVKVIKSKVRKDDIAGVEQEFHFEFRIDLLKKWRKNDKPIHGVILVPYEQDEAGQDVLLESPTPCFLPFSYLFGRNGKMSYAKFVKGKKGANALTPTLNLSKMKDKDGWGLRCSQIKDVIPLPEKDCFASTRLMKRLNKNSK